jgi:two-component system, OmpR family, response regulator
MEHVEHMPVYPYDIYTVTEKGRQELSRGSTTLTANELEILVLMDAKTTAKEILERLPHIEEWDIVTLIPKLIREGYAALASIAEQDNLDFSYFFDAEKTVPNAEVLAQAQLEADAGAPALQRDGYYVSIARRKSDAPHPAPNKRISVLAIEDDPHISALLVQVLKLEGYEARTAMNRAEVLEALRHLPSPDLVLLDIHLPDANGFEILERMKQHPVLTDIPVIMLTGDATRESVSRGLADGADGYITKPFDVAILRKGIKTVLGLDQEQGSQI